MFLLVCFVFCCFCLCFPWHKQFLLVLFILETTAATKPWLIAGGGLEVAAITMKTIYDACEHVQTSVCVCVCLMIMRQPDPGSQVRSQRHFKHIAEARARTCARAFVADKRPKIPTQCCFNEINQNDGKSKHFAAV